MTIKLKDITPAPWNTRGEITEESVAELAESIKEQGLINPITIWLKGELPNNIEARYCIAGNRRLAALLAIYGGKADLKSSWYTFFDGTEHEAKMITVTENLQREDVSPLEEAALVEQCMEDGMTAESIAAKTGRSTSWVNRRKRLVALCEDFKSIADRFTTDQLEKIASFDPAVQKRVAADIDETDTWPEVNRLLSYEAKDLANAKFDTATCQSCIKRTGAQADLWGVCDGCLGQCQDKACFEKKIKDAQEAKIAELTRGASEVVRVRGYWEMPSDEESTPKRDKQHPCAYVLIDYKGDIEVKWGESKAAKDAREAKAREVREAEQKARAAERERADDIESALTDWKDEDEPRGLKEIVAACLAKGLDAKVAAFCADAIAGEIASWHTESEWARILTLFPVIAARAGVSDEDRDYFIGEFAEDEDDEDNND